MIRRRRRLQPFANCLEYNGETRPAVDSQTGRRDWRRKPINRREANVWDPILATRRRSQSDQVYGVKSLDRLCLVFRRPEAQSAPAGKWLGLRMTCLWWSLRLTWINSFPHWLISNSLLPRLLSVLSGSQHLYIFANIYRCWKPDNNIWYIITNTRDNCLHTDYVIHISIILADQQVLLKWWLGLHTIIKTSVP